jgi:hypothetical protein
LASRSCCQVASVPLWVKRVATSAAEDVRTRTRNAAATTTTRVDFVDLLTLENIGFVIAGQG